MRDGFAAGLADAGDEARDRKLIGSRDDAIRAGLEAFHSGRYDEAADRFLLATELDHSDPASRLHAAQALFALEQYDQAAPLVRRALELQPKLIYLKFDLRKDYGNPEDFDEQLDDLKGHLKGRSDWAEGQLLLGYELLFSGQRAEAHQTFARILAMQPSDRLAADLLKASIPLPKARPAKPTPTVQPAGGRLKV